MHNGSNHIQKIHKFIIIFQIRTNKDGSKTQVVRQYGCNTSSANEPDQSVTYEKDSYVYINSGTTPGDDPNAAPEMLPLTLASEDAAASMRMQSDDPFGLQRERPMRPIGSMTGCGVGGGASYGTGGSGGSGAYRSHIVRYGSVSDSTDTLLRFYVDPDRPFKNKIRDEIRDTRYV